MEWGRWTVGQVENRGRWRAGQWTVTRRRVWPIECIVVGERGLLESMPDREMVDSVGRREGWRTQSGMCAVFGEYWQFERHACIMYDNLNYQEHHMIPLRFSLALRKPLTFSE